MDCLFRVHGMRPRNDAKRRGAKRQGDTLSISSRIDTGLDSKVIRELLFNRLDVFVFLFFQLFQQPHHILPCHLYVIRFVVFCCFVNRYTGLYFNIENHVTMVPRMIPWTSPMIKRWCFNPIGAYCACRITVMAKQFHQSVELTVRDKRTNTFVTKIFTWYALHRQFIANIRPVNAASNICLDSDYVCIFHVICF